MTGALRFRGPVLPDGEVRDLYVVDGTVTYEKVASAELVAEGWIVPGLVDAQPAAGPGLWGRTRQPAWRRAGHRR